MSPLLALADGVVFAIGGVVFLAVCCGALVLGYTRFAELGEDDQLHAGTIFGSGLARLYRASTA